MTSNLPGIAAWVECGTPETDLKTVILGIQAWGKCKAVKDIIVTMLPGNEHRFKELRTVCQYAGFRLLPSVKVSPCLRIATTIDEKHYNKFDHVYGWTKVADSIARACYHAQTSGVLLEVESAIKGYVQGVKGCEIDPARLARCFRQLPSDINILWYPALTYIESAEHDRQLAAMRLLFTERHKVGCVDTSIGQPCDYDNPRVRENEKLLRELNEEFHPEWTRKTLARLLWCYGPDEKYWDDSEIFPLLTGSIESQDYAILYPGLQRWRDAAASIGRLLNIAIGERIVD